MKTVLVIDTIGDSRTEIEGAFAAAGWRVKHNENASALPDETADAVILATDAAGLGRALPAVQACRQATGVPLALVVSLDRSGWDRTFGAAAGLDVDALFDRPVNAVALVQRLNGILAAREAVRTPPPAGMPAILDQAIANEITAAAFYRQAAERVADPATRAVLEDLMRDEIEHQCLLEEFKSSAHPLPEDAPPAGSLVETFGTPDFSPGLTPADAFLLAAQKEKLAADFYRNWAGLYPGRPERDLLLRLAEMERGHKARVEALFTNAAFPEAW
jgi:rubrerythrin